jgi:hypothetical protein
MTPTILTNLRELPPIWTRGIVAPTFADALAEYERKYGKAGRVWQYGKMYFFEEAK